MVTYEYMDLQILYFYAKLIQYGFHQHNFMCGMVNPGINIAIRIRRDSNTYNIIIWYPNEIVVYCIYDLNILKILMLIYNRKISYALDNNRMLQ